MKRIFGEAIERATRLTRAQSLVEATQTLMRGLTHAESPAPASQQTDSASAPWIEKLTGAAKPLTGGFDPAPSMERVPAPLGETLERLKKGELPGLGQGMEALAKLRKAPKVAVPDGASWLARTFACETGSRPYKLYAPARRVEGPRPLVVMLHGCTQNPEDFAVGTGMNALAEEHGFVVAYPEQVMRANHLGCWNWFNPQDQQRDKGEPSIIAGLTRALIAEMDIDPKRVFVAGLSAGGAMAEVMSATYPDLYAGAGVHSGLAYGVASDTASAFVAMNGKSRGRPNRARDRVRTIVFHGDADQKVHPTNGELILAEARAGLSAHHQEKTERGNVNGRHYSRTVVADSLGVPQVEYWNIEGLGHAWSGGAPEGSHTDQHGPNASVEMIQFFLQAPPRD
ncbi:alpha/beta hydrolase family esterase [Methylocystis parvus]|uniref:extracellular catalytic domain type 1 short-chain-length polyhydroxyalkanoate depolymerase n=1 Tax=Methylocystis parvus TaxID=134 RepID=UPI003C73658C